MEVLDSIVEYVKNLRWPDFIIAVGLLRGALVGYRDGLLKELLRILLYIFTLVVILGVYESLTEFVGRNTILNDEVSRGLTLCLIAIFTYEA